MRRFSLRTLLLVMLGCSVLCGVFTLGGWHPSVAHLLLVLACALPAGSLAYDRGHSCWSGVSGACIGAIAGNVLTLLFAFFVDYWRVTS